jgi:hypothetical protein
MESNYIDLDAATFTEAETSAKPGIKSRIYNMFATPRRIISGGIGHIYRFIRGLIGMLMFAVPVFLFSTIAAIIFAAPVYFFLVEPFLTATADATSAIALAQQEIDAAQLEIEALTAALEAAALEAQTDTAWWQFWK